MENNFEDYNVASEEIKSTFGVNEFAQGYYKIEDPILVPTYTELVAA